MARKSVPDTYFSFKFSFFQSPLSISPFSKVETKFYENKIRLNGKKIAKKSIQLGVGDEVDVIKGVSPQNDEHIMVGRVEIVSAKAKEENISVILRKSKSLIIENYPGSNAWKGSSENSS